MQSVSSRIWTRVAVSIFYDDNRYTTGTWISSNSSSNNTMRTDYIEVKIDKKPQNNKCGLCGDRDETTNHIISECSK